VLRVAAWNIQRASNPGAEVRASQKRFEYVSRRLLEYLRTPVRPDLFFLSEVTQAGPAMAVAFNTHPNLGRDFKAEYFATRDRNGRASPCSFILISPRGVDIDADAVGGRATRRPYLRVRLAGLTLAGVHLIANRRDAGDEITTMLGDLVAAEHANAGLMLIGDMNQDFAGLTPAMLNAAQNVRFTPVDPGIDVTYERLSMSENRSRKRLVQRKIDYAICSDDVVARADPFWANQRHAFSVIDHAPVFYQVDNAQAPAPAPQAVVHMSGARPRPGSKRR